MCVVCSNWHECRLTGLEGGQGEGLEVPDTADLEGATDGLKGGEVKGLKVGLSDGDGLLNGGQGGEGEASGVGDGDLLGALELGEADVDSVGVAADGDLLDRGRSDRDGPEEGVLLDDDLLGLKDVELEAGQVRVTNLNGRALLDGAAKVHLPQQGKRGKAERLDLVQRGKVEASKDGRVLELKTADRGERVGAEVSESLGRVDNQRAGDLLNAVKGDGAEDLLGDGNAALKGLARGDLENVIHTDGKDTTIGSGAA